MALTRQEAEAHDDVRTDVVKDVWGGDVRIRSMSLRAQSRFAHVSKQFDPGVDGAASLEDLNVAILAPCVIEDTGKPWFTGEDDCRKFLAGRNPDDVEKIADAISVLSGFKRKPDEVVEDFGQTQTDSSGTD